jgi:hypothetical protein
MPYDRGQRALAGGAAMGHGFWRELYRSALGIKMSHCDVCKAVLCLDWKARQLLKHKLCAAT